VATTLVNALGAKWTNSYQVAQAPAAIIAASIPLARLAQAKWTQTVVREISESTRAMPQ
jgi:hypothetical protein